MRHPARGILFSLFLLAFASIAHASDDPNWHIYAADAVVDTLDGSSDELFEAGAWVLVHHDWDVERQNKGLGTMVTAWRPVKHPLVRMATGPAQVRVAFALKELPANRTEVRVLGGIASRTELGAVLPLARAAGRKECLGFVVDLKARALDQRQADGAGSGAHASTGRAR